MAYCLFLDDTFLGRRSGKEPSEWGINCAIMDFASPKRPAGTQRRFAKAAVGLIVMLLPSCSLSDAGLQLGSPGFKDDAASSVPVPTGPDGGTSMKKAQGEACTTGSQCGTGICASDVCCDSTCESGCFSCKLPALVGKCSPVPAGGISRIENTCPKEGANTCGFDGSCDGKGGCRRHVSGTACGQASCAEGTETPASTCDGNGNCVASAPKGCAPYICSNRKCATDCRSDNECANNTQCLGDKQCVIVDAPVIKKTVSVPVVDGEIDDIWTRSAAAWQDISNVNIGTVGSNEDLKARFKALWTTEAFYLLVEITDSSLINDSVDTWNDDSVEVYFDANNSRGQTYDKVDDLQYVFGWNDADFSEGKLNKKQGVTFAIKDFPNGKGYVLEARFPWSTLGANNPAVGKHVGFQLAINDDDLDGGGRDAQVVWYGKLVDFSSRPASFGELVLGGF